MKNKYSRMRMISALVATTVVSGTCWAQVVGAASIREAAQAAVLKNPEVQARWHIFRESVEEVGVAEGGFLPKLDVSASPGRGRLIQDPGRTTSGFSDYQTNVTLRQMLFDGFATLNEVRRLGRAKVVRYFELLDSMENMALEAGRAYLDVIRQRQQVLLAEENYLQHKITHQQLLKRSQSGVGKGVDVDQAESRLALADVNVTTAQTNLHDVTARYLRIIGEQPVRDLATPETLGNAMPVDAGTAFASAVKNNPALRASIENTEAAQYDIESRRAAFFPRADFVARNDNNSNYLDTGVRSDTRVELRVNFNVFNGGSDLARMRQYRERKNVALDTREKVCRDMRQTLAIAYNDVKRLNNQISRIRVQVSLVDKTRTAYRDQFNIGQRTLLDLLNTQNEYFDARRALVNAEIDLSIAHLRSYAGMGRLLDHLGLKRVDDGADASELSSGEISQLCPAAEPLESHSNRVELDPAMTASLLNAQFGPR